MLARPLLFRPSMGLSFPVDGDFIERSGRVSVTPAGRVLVVYIARQDGDAEHDATRALSMLCRRIGELAAREDHRVGILMVAPTRNGLPGLNLRSRIRTELRLVSDDVAAFSAAFEGGPFWASAARTALAVMLGGVWKDVPVAIFRDRTEAIPWLDSQLPGGVVRGRLLSAVSRLADACDGWSPRG